MTIAQSKLIEIRNSAARADLHPFRVEAADMIAICDELMLSRERFGAVSGGAARDLDEGKLDLGKPSDIEVIAERLAKVEDRLAALKDAEFSVNRIGNLARIIGEHHLEVNQRIDKVAEIIGERIAGLVDRLDKLEKPWAYPDTVTVGDPEPVTSGGTFPTGGAHTAEAAAEAVLPVPQRGDRVRLEDALTNNGQRVSGWFDVIGADAKWGCFQIEVAPDDIRKGRWLPWVANDNSGLKEVKRNGTPR